MAKLLTCPPWAGTRPFQDGQLYNTAARRQAFFGGGRVRIDKEYA